MAASLFAVVVRFLIVVVKLLILGWFQKLFTFHCGYFSCCHHLYGHHARQLLHPCYVENAPEGGRNTLGGNDRSWQDWENTCHTQRTCLHPRLTIGHAAHEVCLPSAMKAFLHRLFRCFAAPKQPSSDIERARQLIAAIDRGGLPLDKAIINRIAESFGLEVSKTAAMADTIARIRAALERCDRP